MASRLRKKKGDEEEEELGRKRVARKKGSLVVGESERERLTKPSLARSRPSDRSAL